MYLVLHISNRNAYILGLLLRFRNKQNAFNPVSNYMNVTFFWTNNSYLRLSLNKLNLQTNDKLLDRFTQTQHISYKSSSNNLGCFQRIKLTLYAVPKAIQSWKNEGRLLNCSCSVFVLKQIQCLIKRETRRSKVAFSPSPLLLHFWST